MINKRQPTRGGPRNKSLFADESTLENIVRLTK
jgi:hypothetical protein